MGDAARNLPAHDPAWRARAQSALARVLVAAVRRRMAEAAEPAPANDAIEREPRCE